MAPSPVDVVLELLKNPTGHAVMNRLVAADATYVSLNYENADLQKVLPWTGTHRLGPQGIIDVFVGVGEYWENEEFQIETIFSDQGHVAVFGRFTSRSRALGKSATSPFSILARVSNGQLTYMQFLEDPFATAAAFRTGGAWHFTSTPHGASVTV